MGCLFSGTSRIDILPVRITPTPTVQGNTAIQVEKFTFESNFEKDKTYRIYADSVEMGEEKKIARLKGITCNFYENDKKILTVNSENAEMDIQNKNIRFKNRVVFQTNRGEILELDSLYWSKKEKSIQGEGNIKFMQAPNTGRADKIKGNLDLNTYTMEGNILLLVKSVGKEEK